MLLYKRVFAVVSYPKLLYDFSLSALRGSRVQDRSRSSAYQMEELSQQGLVKDVKDGSHLGGSRGGSSKF